MATTAAAIAAPPVIETVEGDLVALLRERRVDYVVHQANCTTRGARGLAASLFAAFPQANIYARRGDDVSVPGTLIITKPGIVHLFGQFAPGGPTKEEPASVRLHYFRSGLELLAARVRATPGSTPMRLAFPYLIGCGLAGGDWAQYERLISEFAASVQGKARVIIVKLPAPAPRAAAAGK